MAVSPSVNQKTVARPHIAQQTQSALAKERVPMPEAQRAKLVQGRDDSNAVRIYLDALEGRRGRLITQPEVEAEAELTKIEEQLPEARGLGRVLLANKRGDVLRRIDHIRSSIDMSEYEAVFVAHAARYSIAKGINYMAWREAGVPQRVLRRAGIKATSAIEMVPKKR